MVVSRLALASSHSPFAALLLLVKYLCLLLLISRIQGYLLVKIAL